MELRYPIPNALGASPTATALYRLSATVPRSRPIRVTIVKSSRCALFFSTLPEQPSRGKPALVKSSLRSALGQRSLPPARKLAAPGSRQGAWRHANTAPLALCSLRSWSVPGSLRVPGKGRSARATFPKSIYRVLLPSFFAFAFRVNVIRCGGFASGFRGINRVCRHPVVTSFPRVPQPLFIPRPHRSVSSLRSPLRFAKTPNRIPLFTRQTRKNWEEKS